MPEMFMIATICEKFGWTWWDYQNQPAEFIDVVRIKLNIEATFEAKQIEEMKRKTK